MDFSERSENAGLVMKEEMGGYYYTDMFSSVLYTPLFTPRNVQIPHMGIFTSKPEETDLSKFLFVGVVSKFYDFVGNAGVVDSIIQSVEASGQPVFSRRHYMSGNLAELWFELAIGSATNVPSLGDIYPQLSISNSYSGTGAVNIKFGINISGQDGAYGFTFRKFNNNFGGLRKVHHAGFKSTLSTVVGNYVESFGENIIDMITVNFAQPVHGDMVFSLLDLLEKAGKKRRDTFSSYVSQITENGTKPINIWQLFCALVKMSSVETLNVKKYMENLAESVLIMPVKMAEILKQVSK